MLMYNIKNKSHATTVENNLETLEVWAQAARHVLINRPEKTTYLDLHRAVQRILEDDEDDIEHAAQPMLWRVWIGYVLARVTELNLAHGEPLLSAFVVRGSTGEVNVDGYNMAVQIRYGYESRFPELHAADERLAWSYRVGTNLS